MAGSAEAVRIDVGRTRPGRVVGKRALDLVVAGAALLVLAPLMAVLAVVVRLGVGGRVLFRQERAGLGGRPFEVLKFRSMRDARGADGSLLPDAERLTAVGRWLRATSLDELPQLVNVLRGEMSLVGPRPLPRAYVARYSDQERRRLDVVPGLTGWSQVNGRNAMDWAHKLALDVWYVDNRSLRLDLRILARTVRTVLAGDGVTAHGHATMPEFVGTAPRQAA
jgi:lipopolysaccharide/colanic/teichoic acid biosynthesis glycosyltransferase